MKCNQCNFSCKNKLELNLHVEAMRGDNTHGHNGQKEEERRTNFNERKAGRCKFYDQGFCKFSNHNCRFLHVDPPLCRFQLQCPYWPNCNFLHTNYAPNKPCRYQERCKNYNCKFEHYGQNGEHYFLEENMPEMNYQNFPPLGTQNVNKRRSQSNGPWRPW